MLENYKLDSNVFANYRPIFHVSFLSKVLEKVVAVQLNEHLILKKLQNEFRLFYRTGYSTETALIEITNHILAFDSVDPNILLDRLSTCFYIENSVCTWFQSYLCYRSQSVIVNNIAFDSF